MTNNRPRFDRKQEIERLLSLSDELIRTGRHTDSRMYLGQAERLLTLSEQTPKQAQDVTHQRQRYNRLSQSATYI